MGIRRKAEQVLFKVLYGALRVWLVRKSQTSAIRAGHRLGRLLFRVGKKQRERTYANLALAFPEMSEADRDALARRTFEHWGTVAVDFVRYDTFTDEECASRTDVKGIENLEHALKEGKGVMLVSGHFGSWEWSARWFRARGLKLYAVVRDANQQSVNEVVERHRSESGFLTISRGNAAKELLRRLKENHAVVTLSDQNTDESFVPFFGKPCGTVLGPAVISRRSGAPLIPCFARREGDRFILEFGPPLQPLPGYESEIEALTAAMNLVLETAVREHPEEYLWLHDRWKAARQRGLQ